MKLRKWLPMVGLGAHSASVRVRTTVAATLVVAVAFAGAGTGLVLLLRTTMLDNVDTGLRVRAEDIAALVRDGTAPADLAVGGEEDGFVQVIATDGRVVAASRNVQGEGPIAQLASGSFRTLGHSPLDAEPFRLHAVTLPPPGGATILVGQAIADLRETVTVVAIGVGIALPALLVLVAITTWLVVGRALRPVERIRAEVADISATDLHRRVPPSGSHDEIGRLATTMNAMLDRLERAQQRERRFVADASHELRTPLAVMQHTLEIAARDGPRADWPAVASDLLAEDLRMQRLVDDLLWLARHDAGEGPRILDLVDLDDLVLDEARRPRQGPRIDLTQVSAGQVRGSADALVRVVSNLLDNAVAQARSQVSLALAAADGAVCLTVDDDGPGIPPDRRDHIFERFGRLETSRTRTGAGGAGLGLAIAAEIAQQHGGTLTVDDSPRLGGARFTLRLPDARAGGREKR